LLALGYVFDGVRSTDTTLLGLILFDAFQLVLRTFGSILFGRRQGGWSILRSVRRLSVCALTSGGDITNE
jgi:hypothetical protein